MLTTQARISELERELRLARTRRKQVASDLAEFLGVPVALDGWWRPTVLIDGEQVRLSDLVPISPVLKIKSK